MFSERRTVVPYILFENCIKIKKWLAFKPDVIKYKYHPLSINNFVFETDDDNTVRVELINIEGKYSI